MRFVRDLPDRQGGLSPDKVAAPFKHEALRIGKRRGDARQAQARPAEPILALAESPNS
jgi:hypothetical protein